MRNHAAFLVLMGVFIMGMPLTASAGMYQWQDQNGNVIFSDSPPSDAKVTEKKYQEQRFEGAGGSSKDSKVVIKEKKGSQQKTLRSASEISVILYSTNWCPYCKQARDYLRSLGVRLVEYDIEADKRRADELRQKSGGSKGVPLIDVEGIILRGYSPESISAAVEKKKAER